MSTETQRTKSQQVAFNFLTERMPNDYDMAKTDWIGLLMDFEDNKGHEAIEGLAGFYLFAIRRFSGEKVTRSIHNVFSHDINGMKDKFCEPKSSGYVEIWKEEYEKYNQPVKESKVS